MIRSSPSAPAVYAHLVEVPPYATRRAPVSRLPGGRSEDDRLAVEEPLEIRINGRPIAVTMRTPGHDEELALGFCLTEGLRPVGARPPDDLAANVVEVEAPDADLGRVQRSFYTSSSCGVCGKGALEAVAVDAPRVDCDLSSGSGSSPRCRTGCVRHRRRFRSRAASTRRVSSQRTASFSACARTSADTTRWTRCSAGLSARVSSHFATRCSASAAGSRSSSCRRRRSRAVRSWSPSARRPRSRSSSVRIAGSRCAASSATAAPRSTRGPPGHRVKGLTGALLVGGASERFGSPKALAQLRGETLAARGLGCSRRPATRCSSSARPPTVCPSRFSTTAPSRGRPSTALSRPCGGSARRRRRAARRRPARHAGCLAGARGGGRCSLRWDPAPRRVPEVAAFRAGAAGRGRAAVVAGGQPGHARASGGVAARRRHARGARGAGAAGARARRRRHGDARPATRELAARGHPVTSIARRPAGLGTAVVVPLDYRDSEALARRSPGAIGVAGPPSSRSAGPHRRPRGAGGDRRGARARGAVRAGVRHPCLATRGRARPRRPPPGGPRFRGGPWLTHEEISAGVLAAVDADRPHWRRGQR